MIENEPRINERTRSEVTQFLNSAAGRQFMEWLESNMPSPEVVTAPAGGTQDAHVYHIRAGVTQGYIDCLYNMREFPNLELEHEKTEIEPESTE